MIQTRNLAFAHPGTKPLVFADLDVPQGATLLVRGASGVGKSTWLSLAAGLRTPSSGQITVAGQALGDLTGAARDTWRAQAVGFLPQRLHLSDALTVHGNLALVYFAAGLAQDDAAIAQALAALGVGDLAGRKPHQLSGGQAQRVALARAVLLAPPSDPGRRTHGQPGRRCRRGGAGPAADQRPALWCHIGDCHPRPADRAGAAICPGAIFKNKKGRWRTVGERKKL